MAKAKISISLESFSPNHLNQACKNLLEILAEPDIFKEIKFKGPISFPTRRRIYCLLRSPHINKDAREQFEIRRYKKLLEIYTSSLKVLDTLLKLNSIGEGIEVKIAISKLK
jgi:small subunit ribosomal protein S10